MIIQPTNFNPLKLIIDYFPDNHCGPLTLEQLEHIRCFLALGGVICESDTDTVSCLMILKDLGIIDIKQQKSNNEIYYEVIKIYGK